MLWHLVTDWRRVWRERVWRRRGKRRRRRRRREILFRGYAVNEEDPERDHATQV